MKKYTFFFSIIIAIALLGTLPSAAGAVSYAPKSVRADVSESLRNLRGKIASHSEDLRDHITSRSERVTRAKQQQVKRWWNKTQRRLNVIVTRQSNLTDKMQQRITALAGNGTDIAAAQNALDDAKTKITAAQQALTTATSHVADIIANNTPMNAFKKIHDFQRNIMDAIRSAQQALVKAAVAIRQATHTPTPTTTPMPTPVTS